MRKNIIFILLMSILCCKSESFDTLYTQNDIVKLLNNSVDSDKLKIGGEQEVTIIFDNKLYETYFIKLNDNSYYKSPTLANLRYLYSEFYKKKHLDENDFFYNVLNFKKGISKKIVEQSIANNMISGQIFNLDEKISLKYKKGGINILIKDYIEKTDSLLILNNDIEFNLNELNTIIYYFYINNYRLNIDDNLGLYKFYLREDKN